MSGTTNEDNGISAEELEEMNKLRAERRRHLEEIKKMGLDPFGSKYEAKNKAREIKDNFAELEGEQVSLSGRLMAVRSHGRASFADLQDFTGRIQLYFRQDEVGEENYEFFQGLDIGDFIGLEGEVFKTNRGEISVKVTDFTFQTKALRPLPEKFHGLKDKELRYRQRYLDLIVNPEVKDTFIKRSEIIKEIRSYLENQGFLEVETPMMHPIAGGATARPFITHHNALDIDLYLRIAPELYLKRLIVGGLEKVFEINRNFRNEGMSYKHNPEFTMMELYQANADYHDMMELTENLVATVAEKVLDTTTVEFEGQEIDLSTPWPRMTMIEAVKEYTGLDFNEITDDAKARQAARDLGLSLEDSANSDSEPRAASPRDSESRDPSIKNTETRAFSQNDIEARDSVLNNTEAGSSSPNNFQTKDSSFNDSENSESQQENLPGWGEILNLIFEERVEEKLIQPVFIKDYPIEVSPLAKRIEDRPELTYRFEPFICARELGNAFTELNNPLEQRRRFEAQVSRRETGDDEAHMMDEDYVRALEYGMPPTGGLGIGIDRLVMLLTDSSSIKDVILFPTMRPEN